jgi:hypothetical protein
MDLTEFIYRAKKWYPLFPGVVQPKSGAFLHDHYVRRATARSLVRAFIDAAVGLAFHAWIPLRARAVQRRFGLDNAWRKRAIAICHSRFADPNDIALFRVERAGELDAYIRRFEDAALNKLINPIGWTPACVLADKESFYGRCVEASLPHPEIVAVIQDTRAEIFSSAANFPLLAKPARGEGGRDVAFLDVDPAVATEQAAFAAWAKSEYGRRGGKWIIQRRLAPHPMLKDLALGALATARITTILNEAGLPEPVSAVLRFASDPASQVDNMKAGGLLAPIDLATGRLGPACKGYGGGDHVVHPVTGVPIAGLILPHWEDAKELAVRAHRSAFNDYALIGWDIGLTDQGPMLVEGNAKPGVLMPQRAARQGLGGQRYGQLLAFQLERAAATKS